MDESEVIPKSSIQESAVLAACMLALSRAGALAWRNNSGLLIGANGRRIRAGVPGSADILACYRGFFLAVECKTPAGRLRKSQENYRNAVSHAGGIYIMARSDADVASAIRDIDAVADCLAAAIRAVSP